MYLKSQNRSHTESTFENLALGTFHLSARVRRRPPVYAQCCGTLLLYCWCAWPRSWPSSTGRTVITLPCDDRPLAGWRRPTIFEIERQ
jgi:hypothetical protein